MSTDTGGEREADDVTLALRALDGVIDRGRVERLCEGQEPFDVARRLIAMVATEGDDPAFVLHREDEGAATAVGSARQEDRPQPIRRSVVGNVEDGRGMGLIDTDLGLVGFLGADAVEERHCHGRATGSVDDEIGWQRLVPALGILVSHRRHPSVIRGSRQFPDAATRAQPDIALPLDMLPRHEFEQGPGHA